MIADREALKNLEKSNARNVAHIRKTGHFFRFVFAEEFVRDRNSRILSEMARPPRLERGTPGLEGRCSIQLSYGRVNLWYAECHSSMHSNRFGSKTRIFAASTCIFPRKDQNRGRLSE